MGYLIGVSRLSSILCVVLLLQVDANYAKSISARDYDELDDSEILCMALIHRHGDRTPLGTYPTDPYIDYDWPRGSGTLTERGCQQLYQLGLNTRERYGSLMNPDGVYDTANAHHVASSPERTRMSGAAMLAGFYKPRPNEGFMKIDWQPVPMTVYPAKEDHVSHSRVKVRTVHLRNTSLHRLSIKRLWSVQGTMTNTLNCCTTQAQIRILPDSTKKIRFYMHMYLTTRIR